MEIIREYFEREGCYNFYLKEGEQILKIIFGGNLDLYWILYNTSKIDKNLSLEEMKKIDFGETKYSFTITKENYFLYSLFEEIYNDIKESRIFIPREKTETEEKIENDEEDFDIWKSYDETKLKEMNEKYKKIEAYTLLFDGKTIEWHSDDDQYERADIVKINKVDDTFVLEFIRPSITEDNFIYRTPGCISIRFRNSGSTYDPYNIIFMRMFNKLQEYNPEYHQLHMEELIYKKVLKK